MSRQTDNTNGALWASAFVLGAMIVFSASKHSPLAVADNALTGDGFTMLTAENGQGSDFLYIIDDHSSMLMVYDIPDPQNRQFIRPVASWSLPALFGEVRRN